MPAIGKELFALFVVVIVLESALATLFQWRAYMIVANGRAWKTPILFIAGMMVVAGLNYDPFARLLLAASIIERSDLGWRFFTGLVSALIMAGGSAGVNSLLRPFGIRNSLSLETPLRPSADKAWVAILLKGDRPAKPAQIILEKIPDARRPVAGSIDGASVWAREAVLFMRDPMRFPSYGGSR